MICSIVEYWIEWLSFTPIKSISVFLYIGMAGTFIGQILRSAAMITARENFTHLVAQEKEDEHKLVTSGIYQYRLFDFRYLRHPSYTGFFYWGVFLQLSQGNLICTAAYAYVLQNFFRERIAVEEESLVSFFGDTYSKYQTTSFVGIPGIH